jgi:hypothetical protein
MAVTRIYLDLPPKLVRPQKRNGYKTGEAPHYVARLHGPAGEIIVKDTPIPFLDAARILLQRGVTGILELWDSERPYPRMRGDIAEMAKLTVVENDKTGPLFGKYQPFPNQ